MVLTSTRSASNPHGFGVGVAVSVGVAVISGVEVAVGLGGAVGAGGRSEKCARLEVRGRKSGWGDRAWALTGDVARLDQASTATAARPSIPAITYA
jgi:hypothetical protein